MNTQEGICSVRCKTHTLTHFLCLQRSGKTGFLTSLTSCAWFLFTVAFQLLAVNSQECWSRHLRLTAWYILVQVPPRACQGCAIATGQLAAAKGFWPGPVSNQYCSILQFVPYIALVTWQMVIPTPFSSYPGTGISPLQPFNTLSFSFFIFLPPCYWSAVSICAHIKQQMNTLQPTAPSASTSKLQHCPPCALGEWGSRLKLWWWQKDVLLNQNLTLHKDQWWLTHLQLQLWKAYTLCSLQVAPCSWASAPLVFSSVFPLLCK